MKEEPKKETLEEAFDKIYNSIDFTEFDFASFKLGTKWQQERMYSEEEVLTLVDNLFHKYSSDFRVSAKIDTKEWFEQFKNK